MMINKLTFLAVLLINLLLVSLSVLADTSNTDRQVMSLLQSVKQSSVQERIEQFSGALMNVPYLLEPLGEGVNGEYNQQPLYRLDSFDCETYVDTVLALVLSQDLQAFQQNINAIRYNDEQITFQNRNHFTSADWIPNNKNKGLIRDITRQIAGEHTQVSRIFIDRKSWYQHLPLQRIQIAGLTQVEKKDKLNKLRALSGVMRSSATEIDYIPIEALFGDGNLALVNKIPSGAIIFLVRHDKKSKKLIGTDNDISHMGFVIKKQGQLYFREASSYAVRVIDVALLRYLSFYLPAGELKGISVWEVITRPQSSYSQAELSQSK